MKNKRYISCTDKRVVITFVVSLVVFVAACLLLHKGGHAPGILKENAITSTLYWFFIIVLFFAGLITSFSTATIFVMGSIMNWHYNRKRSKSLDPFSVTFNTKRHLTEDQKRIITTIVKDGISSDVELSDIAIEIMMSTGIYDIIVLNRIENDIEVFI